MFTTSNVVAVINNFDAAYREAFQKFSDVRKAELLPKLKASFEEAQAALQGVRDGIEAVAKGTAVEDARIAEFYSSLTAYDSDGAITSVKLTIRTKPSSEVQYRITKDVDVTDNIIADLCEVYRDTLIQILWLDFANSNLAEVNTYVAEACAEAGVAYKFEFALADKFISAISDDCVQFGIGVDKALELATYTPFAKGSEFIEYSAEKYKEKFIETLKGIDNVPQLVRANIEFITTATGNKNLRRTDKLVRQCYHKQARYFGTVKTGIGYYAEDVEIGGETVSVFAVLEKTEDGEIKTVLSPFDVKTNFGVDYDVVAAVKKLIAG